ncbi:hypothetical protein OBBRIDRAFT_368652 [Obba rivulosa]|uniref:Uncharacterized protein n=1 Tax=Obba rivulosa TaxID=1052685 RepID=A0A8E2DUF5_9APHY|nr:hypothetical protein OBBRIDRAFT_368652 [Obba rivulosa]
MLPLQSAVFALAAYLGLIGGNVMPRYHINLAVLHRYAPLRSIQVTFYIFTDVISAELITVQSNVDNFLTSVDIHAYLASMVPPSVEDSMDSSALYWTIARVALANIMHPGECSRTCSMDPQEDAIPNFDLSLTPQEPGKLEQFVVPLLEPLPAHVMLLPEPLPGAQCHLDVAKSPREISGLLVSPSTTGSTSSHFPRSSDSTHKPRILASPAQHVDLYGLGVAWYMFCFGQLSDFLERPHLGLSAGVPPFVLCIFLGFVAGKIIKYLTRMGARGRIVQLEVIEVHDKPLLFSSAVRSMHIALPEIEMRLHAASVPAAWTSVVPEVCTSAPQTVCLSNLLFYLQQAQSIDSMVLLEDHSDDAIQAISSSLTLSSPEILSEFDDAVIHACTSKLTPDSVSSGSQTNGIDEFSVISSCDNVDMLLQSPPPSSLEGHSDGIGKFSTPFRYNDLHTLPRSAPPRMSDQSSLPSSSLPTSPSSGSLPFMCDVSFEKHSDDINKISSDDAITPSSTPGTTTPSSSSLFSPHTPSSAQPANAAAASRPAVLPHRIGHNIPGLPPTPINQAPLSRPSARSIAEPMRQPQGRGSAHSSRGPRSRVRGGRSRLVTNALHDTPTNTRRSGYTTRS